MFTVLPHQARDILISSHGFLGSQQCIVERDMSSLNPRRNWISDIVVMENRR